jgi:hypothetical protein
MFPYPCESMPAIQAPSREDTEAQPHRDCRNISDIVSIYLPPLDCGQHVDAIAETLKTSIASRILTTTGVPSFGRHGEY